jgi:hypothetical protein
MILPGPRARPPNPRRHRIEEVRREGGAPRRRCEEHNPGGLAVALDRVAFGSRTDPERRIIRFPADLHGIDQSPLPESPRVAGVSKGGAERLLEHPSRLFAFRKKRLIRNPLDRSGISYSLRRKNRFRSVVFAATVSGIAKRSPGNRIRMRASMRPKPTGKIRSPSSWGACEAGVSKHEGRCRNFIGGLSPGSSGAYCYFGALSVVIGASSCGHSMTTLFT